MKKLLILVIAVAVVGAVYVYRGRLDLPKDCPNETGCVPVTIDSTVVTDKSKPAEFGIINHINTVVLILGGNDGQRTFKVTRENTGQKLETQFETDDSPVDGTVVLLDEHTVYQGGADDILIPYVVNYGGSGSFVYIGLFKRENDTTLVARDLHLIGDRIVIEDIGIGDNLEEVPTSYPVQVHVLDRGEEESFAATPTIRKTMTVFVSDHRFMEEASVP